MRGVQNVSFPTSNHNEDISWLVIARVVYVSFPTSNHNSGLVYALSIWLYMSLFLHQTTTSMKHAKATLCCICLFSYIKPQHYAKACIYDSVVYVSFPTSNHNNLLSRLYDFVLYMSLFLHQTTTFQSLKNS